MDGQEVREVVHHSSAFLLPSIPADHLPPLSYALVLLNQRLPRFTPLLWQHGMLRSSLLPAEIPRPSSTSCSLPPDGSMLDSGDVLVSQTMPAFSCIFCWCCLVQQSCGSVLMEARIGCLTRCLTCFLMKRLLPSETGELFRLCESVINVCELKIDYC